MAAPRRTYPAEMDFRLARGGGLHLVTFGWGFSKSETAPKKKKGVAMRDFPLIATPRILPNP